MKASKKRRQLRALLLSVPQGRASCRRQLGVGVTTSARPSLSHQRGVLLLSSPSLTSGSG
jgi:hypothetical protein